MLRCLGTAHPATLVNTLLANAARASSTGKAAGSEASSMAPGAPLPCKSKPALLLSMSSAHSRPASSSTRSTAPAGGRFTALCSVECSAASWRHAAS